MSFLSAEFCLFLTIALFAIWSGGMAWRRVIGRRASGVAFQALLLALSAGFYAFWGLFAFGLLLCIVAAAWLAGRLAADGPRWVLPAALTILFAPLLFFKYSHWIFLSTYSAEYWAITGMAISLPLGISFYTFQAVAYVVDRWRNAEANAITAFESASFLLYFPQLVAGPIVLARHLVPEIKHIKILAEVDWRGGAVWILSGYAKKALLADNLGLYVDRVFAGPAEWSGAALALAVAAYTLQIYLDFSGYSDIAIGVSKLLGINLPLNFNRPYAAASFQDFWRRWHITLSRWLRDYLYIPLGGSRNGQARMIAALFLTMTLGGLWHGAAWNFLFWGAAHGFLLIIERYLPSALREGVARHAYRIFVIGSVALLWVLFRTGSGGAAGCEALECAGLVYGRLFSWAPGRFSESGAQVTLLVLATVALFYWRGERVRVWLEGLSAPRLAGIAAATAAVLLLWAPGDAGFIYFVF